MRTRTSKQPLTLGKLLDFFLGAWRLDEVLGPASLRQSVGAALERALAQYAGRAG